MISIKGIKKYAVYLFIAGWMFVLGIMVGRGSAPVTFDTQPFQKRLETIVDRFGQKQDSRQKVELTFYDVLDRPALEEGETLGSVQEILPGKVSPVPVEEGDEKISKKRMTLAHRTGDFAPENPPEPVAVQKPEKNPAPASGRYTVQVAAYRQLKDAVAQSAILEKKGVSSYRVTAEKDGETWYRVRSGSFHTHADAAAFKQKLDQIGIQSMILKKEDNENIQP